jgi:hypothetical protein
LLFTPIVGIDNIPRDEVLVRKIFLLILLAVSALPGCCVLELHSPIPLLVDATQPVPHPLTSAVARSDSPSDKVGG